ncbi:hypothetical protein P3T35_007822 [Kitasatospora sp. GP30]|nr:hypothetical protein [Kitasatospora sp. GP30]
MSRFRFPSTPKSLSASAMNIDSPDPNGDYPWD